MIQFNLLPDVKQEYVKARRTKRQVVTLAVVSAGAALGLFVVMFLGVNVWQKHVISDNRKKIQSSIDQLKQTPDLDKILTIQNQLNSLNSLHDQKPVTSRLFTYLPQVTPNNLTISDFNVDFEKSTISFTGDADNIGTVNKFVDTLKFTNYKIDDGESKPAFSQVVLGSFGLSAGNDKGKQTTYQITLKSDPVIFDSTKNVSLVVPKQITTRSETEKPNNLFDTLQQNKKAQ